MGNIIRPVVQSVTPTVQAADTENLSISRFISPAGAVGSNLEQNEIALNSRDVLFMNEEQSTYYSNKLREGDQPELSGFSNLLIRARRTDYTIVSNPQLVDPLNPPEPKYIMSFFENERKYSSGKGIALPNRTCTSRCIRLRPG